ncbi:MAG: hypothetical protein PVS2B3_07080 [Steroidobacteraceae bacterium]
MRILATAALLVPAMAFASGSPFDGTWKARLDSLKMTGKPDVWQIADGEYTCRSCVPPVKVQADGAMHRVAGHPYYDELAVHVLGATSVELTQKQGGKAGGSVVYTVSADGNTLTGKFTDHSGAEPVTGTYTETRVGPAAAGAHAFSGSWQQSHISEISDAGRTVSYETAGDHFRMRANGMRYDARFDGKEYPVEGDPGHTRVTVKRIDANTIEEIDHRQGRVADEIRLTISADGNSLTITDNDVVHGQTSTITFDRQ